MDKPTDQNIMWEKIIEIAATEGLPVALLLLEKWLSKAAPTQADYEQLRSMCSQSAEDRARAVLVKNGIALDSDKAKELLLLVKSSVFTEPGKQ